MLCSNYVNLPFSNCNDVCVMVPIVCYLLSMQVTDFKFHVYIASSNGQQRECLLFLRYRPARS